MTRALLWLTLAAALLSLASAAGAQGTCFDHDTMARTLGSTYGESRQTIAIDKVGRLVETWSNPATSTWSVTLTTPANGLTCLVLFGEAWERTYEPPAMAEGEPA